MKTLVLHDGRTLAYTDVGDPHGYPLIFGHGMPGCRLQGQFFHNQALRHGFRVLTPDRPGIGGSAYQLGRQLQDYPKDIGQLADSLGLDKFSHFGWSSGASRTLACCHALKHRVELGVCLSGYTNFSEYDSHQALLKGTRWLARYSPALVKLVVRLIGRLSRRHPKLYMWEAKKLVNQSDQDLLNQLLRSETFQQDQLVCLESGGKAIATDLLTELKDWGFHLSQISTPVLIYQGKDDAFVPVDYARHLAEQLPNAELTLIPSTGHLYPLAEDFQNKLFANMSQRLTRSNFNRSSPPL